MRNISTLLVLSLCLKVSALTAQIPYFQSYQPLKNQPVEVNKLFQDSKGFVWFGTNKGLFRFDGIHYARYTRADSLPDDRVTALAEDSLGRIWIGLQNGSLSYLENGRIHKFEPQEGSAVEPVSDIVFDRHGNMWFSTLNDGLYYFVDDRLYRLDEKEGMPDLYVYDLFEDAVGNIWAGTDGGIAVCSLSDRDVSIDVINSEDGLPDIIIKKIRFLNSDTLSLATEDEGILNFNIKTHQFRPVLSTAWDHGSISDFVIKENQVWISVPSKGLIVFDRHLGQTKFFSQYSGISLRSINTLLKDTEGNIWSGSKTGLSRTSGDAVEHIESLDPAKDANVHALAVDNRDRIWFSTGDGLYVQEENKDGISSVKEKLLYPHLRKSAIISLYADEKGFIWAGLYGDGLLRIHPETNRIKHFKDEICNGNILGITGKGNTVWIATLGGSSSIKFDGDEYVIRNYTSADGLSSDFIYQVFIDSQGRTWFATDGKGVSMLDDGGFHHYQEGLGSKVVYNFAEDSDGKVWVTSQDNGIYRFDGKQFAAVADLSLRDNSVQSIVADDQGNLIAMHTYGIDVYDINRKRMRYWGEETGIRDKVPNLNAVAKDKHGQFFIGTSKGIIKFSLSNDHLTSLPQPTIESVSIYDEVVDISSNLKLNHNENNITVRYLGFWYQNAENLNYLYKLENYDLEWISTRDQEVTYSRLPPGDYTFKVKVSDTDDFSQAKESTLAFSISPPFWETGTFYVFVVGLFVIAAYSVMKYRERQHIEDKLILEAKVEERTREIQQKTEEIQAQNEEIMAQAEEIQGINENLEMLVKQRTAELEKKNQALEEYAFINAHKLRSPVASILGLLNLLSKGDPKDDAKVIRQHLQESAEKLDAVVRSITKVIEKADNKFS